MTLINARLVAERRGLALSERFAPPARDGAPLTIELRATSSGEPRGDGHGHSVAGALDEAGAARIVAMDGFPVALEASGHLLFISHRDQPGRIGAVGTLLGRRGVNIAAMQVGRRQVRGDAVMIVTLDDPLPRPVLEEMRAIPGLSHAHYVDLGAGETSHRPPSFGGS